MIATDKTKILDLKYNDLFPQICEALNELYTLSGKFKDVEQIKIFAQSLTKDLPYKYPYITIELLRDVFAKAIMGEYGDIKTIALPDIYKWLRKWQETAESNSIYVPLANADAKATDIINWSKETYKTYARYLSAGLNVGDFSHLIYDRLQLDNFIEIEGYRKHIARAAHMMNDLPDFLDGRQRELAKRFSVLEVFESLKNKGVPEIYKLHKDDI